MRQTEAEHGIERCEKRVKRVRDPLRAPSTGAAPKDVIVTAAVAANTCQINVINTPIAADKKTAAAIIAATRPM